MSDDDRPNDDPGEGAAPPDEAAEAADVAAAPKADIPPPPGAPAPADASAADVAAMLQALDRKIDTLAGATAAVVSTQTDLLDRNAEAEARRGEDALDVAQRLDALERQVLALSTAGTGSGPDRGSFEPLVAGVAELTTTAAQQREDLALALDVLARMAEALERSDARTEDRLAAVRDAAAIPVADLQALLTARADRTDAQLGELVAALEDADAAAAPSGERDAQTDGTARMGAMADRVTERVDELAEAVRGLTWQLPEITQEVAALRERVEGADVSGAVSAAAEDLALHTDTALAGVVRLFDERLTALRTTFTEATSGGGNGGGNQAGMGFEAGAVMGAAQAAWNRLEQRIDSEFDDLGRQLHSMAALIERALATAEAAVNRPVVTGDQLRHAASTVKDTVMKASRSRRDRRGGPRSLGPGPS